MLDAKGDGREPQDALAELWSLGGGAVAMLDRVDCTGTGPVLPSSFCVATAAQVSIAAAGLAAAEIHRLRNGQLQCVRVDRLHAVTEFLSERYLRIDGEAPELWDNWSAFTNAAMDAGYESTPTLRTIENVFWTFLAAQLCAKRWFAHLPIGRRLSSKNVLLKPGQSRP
jgi:hypothetical protein